jgi:hypothetical protein
MRWIISREPRNPKKNPLAPETGARGEGTVSQSWITTTNDQPVEDTEVNKKVERIPVAGSTAVPRPVSRFRIR